MNLRLMKLPSRSLALLVGGLMIGTALAPVGAQQLAPAEGQVAVRSDGAVYVILNGQRRWVATVQITDEELNAYPEGEPIYAGLAPAGSGSAASTSAAATPTTVRAVGSPVAGSSPTPLSSTTTSPSTGSATPTTAAGSASTTGAATGPTAVSTPTGAISEIDPLVPIEVDIDGTPRFEVGERIIVNVKTKNGAACELAVKWPNGTEVDQQATTPDSRGRCRYSIEIPSTMTVGTGVLKGITREGGRVSRQDVEFEIAVTT